MERQSGLEKIEEECEILEEGASKIPTTKLLESTHNITQLTERCSQLVGTNTKLDQQVRIDLEAD